MASIKPVPGPQDQPPPYFQDGQGAGPYPPGPGPYHQGAGPYPPGPGQYPPGQGPYPPGPGWNNPQQQPMYPAPAPGQGATIIVQPVRNPGVVIVGGCPHCAGVLEDTFGFCAIVLCILFFPIGLLCCLAMKEKRCTNCGAHF